MKVKNMPERRNARRKSALKRALSANRLKEAQNLAVVIAILGNLEKED